MHSLGKWLYHKLRPSSWSVRCYSTTTLWVFWLPAHPTWHGSLEHLIDSYAVYKTYKDCFVFCMSCISTFRLRWDWRFESDVVWREFGWLFQLIIYFNASLPFIIKKKIQGTWNSIKFTLLFLDRICGLLVGQDTACLCVAGRIFIPIWLIYYFFLWKKKLIR